MKNFTYFRPTNVNEAIGLLEPQWGKAELLAGGTDLLDMQKEYVAQPDKVISLGGVQDGELTGLSVAAAGAMIGAGVTLAQIAEHKELQRLFPALTAAAGQVGGPQIRNMGTLGGNLCQRNRCWYFRDEPSPCLLRGGSVCSALDGQNLYHAVFTQGHPCVMVNPSTLAPALIVLGAVAIVQGAKGKRDLALERFFQAPREAGQREHVLEPNEVVLAVRIPASDLKNASYEVRHKQSYDWPLVQAAAAFKVSGGKANDVRICLGHVAPTPLVVKKAALSLENQELTEATAAKAGAIATEGARPLADNGYKVQLIQVAVKRAVLAAAGKAAAWEWKS
jgi:xanthine dehydrogenase YagS FAD-binding subunit